MSIAVQSFVCQWTFFSTPLFTRLSVDVVFFCVLSSAVFGECSRCDRQIEPPHSWFPPQFLSGELELNRKARVAGIHGVVLILHTVFFRVPSRATHHHNTPHRPQHSTHTIHTPSTQPTQPTQPTPTHTHHTTTHNDTHHITRRQRQKEDRERRKRERREEERQDEGEDEREEDRNHDVD